MRMECGCHQSGLYFGSNAIEPDQKYSRVRQSLPKNQLAEVFVGSQQNPPVIHASIQHSAIVNPGRSLGDKYDVVAVSAETIDNLLLDVLVGDDPHADACSIG